MPEIGAVDTDWTYTSPRGSTSTPITRHANVSGWSSASTGGVAGITRWITGNNMIYGDHYYASKEFEIPEGVTTAVLNLRTLSFVRSWTYLVKKNTNGTESETLITNTVWQNDGARGWLNSRNPEVINYPLAAGKYFIKVKVFTNNSGQRQATETNANVNFGNAIVISPIAEFSATLTSAFVGNNVQFTNMSQGTPSSLLWKFEDGANVLTSTNNNPAVAFSTVGNHYAELNADYGNNLISSLRINNYIQTVTQDTPLVAVTQPSCGVSSGAITVTSPTSGVTYSFDNGVTFQSSNTLSGLPSGTYVVKVKNENGAVSAATNAVINPAPTVPGTPMFNITQPTCDINTGSVTVTLKLK
ncbi:PKD domain-containing protein [Chryseobacterium sp. LC2016-29]|uniref:PKD domain-containing protein n=1 Tax=Chryseobacterium sp. LC2016-29 TaxID=2897331 RepID=UPI001E59A3F3|nr:PKD domain-containing protein [Chryseobacterium sp. LC2016-29]MCD0477269.1 PKD domain-containing protein [Chryseobacterium sp. LC2016-29]